MAEIDTRPRSAPLAPDFNHAQRSSSLDYALASTSRNPSYGNVVVTVAGPSSSSTNEEQLTTDFGSSAGGGSSLYGSLLSAGASLDLSASQPSLLDDGQLLSSTGDLTAGLSTLPDGLLQLPDLNDEDLSASSRLEFPEVPAMLFEQAPEYEYSAHTRANVFSDASLDRLVAGALSSGGYHYDAPLGRSPAAPDHNLWNQMTDVPGPSDAFDPHQQQQQQQPQQFALLPAEGATTAGAAEERINSANGSVGASSSFLGGEGVVESSGAPGASGAASGASSYPQHHTAPDEHPTAYHRHHPTHHHHHQQYHEHRSYPPSQGGANAYAQQRYSEPMAAPVSVHEGGALDERGYQRSWADIPDYGQDGQPLIKRRRGSPSSAMLGRRESPRPWAGGQDTHGSSAASTTSHRAPYHTSFAPPVPVSDVSPADTAAAAALTTPSLYQPTLPRSGPSPAMAYAALPPRGAPRSGHSPTPRYAQAGSHHLYTEWAGSAGPSANAYARQPPGPGYHHHPSSSPSSAFAAHSQFRSDPSTWGAAHHHGSTSNGGGANGRGRSQPRRASSGSVTGNGNDSDDGEGGSIIDAPPPTERAVSLAQAALKGGNGTAQQADMLAALNDTLASSLETDGVARCPFPNCTKTFAKNRSYNLKTHLRSHSQLKPFACASCPRAFSRKHDLERHARVHSGDKPYICEVCGRGFPRSDALRRHWRVEKECGDKASEIEAGQPLPSVPPGATGMHAHAHALAAHAHAHPATMSMPLKQMMPGQHGVFAAPTSMPGPWHHGGAGGGGGGPQYGLPPQQQQQPQQRGPPSGQQGSQAPPPGFVPLPPSHHLSVGTKRPREDW